MEVADDRGRISNVPAINQGQQFIVALNQLTDSVDQGFVAMRVQYEEIRTHHEALSVELHGR